MKEVKVESFRLKEHMETLISFPNRSYDNLEGLNQSAAYIKKQFESIGLVAQEQVFIVDNETYKNIVAVIGQEGNPKIVIGAHYDVCGEQDGADDNASGISGLIELARVLKQGESQLKYRIEFVAYSLEEPPFFSTQSMGSYIHARSLFEKGEKIKLMICLEMIAYFSDEENSQDYPFPGMNLLYPRKGNFIAAVSNLRSSEYIKLFKDTMKEYTTLPCEVLAAPRILTGIDFSDHRNYWKFEYPAIMITDTAFYRNKNYHLPTDTIDTLDIPKMTEVVKGLSYFILSGKI